MSSPVVTGLVGLVLQRVWVGSCCPNPPDQIKWLVVSTARSHAGQPGTAGVARALSALQRAAQGNVGRANQGYTTPSSSRLAPVVGLLGSETARYHARTAAGIP
jgi:hypothetical protein